MARCLVPFEFLGFDLPLRNPRGWGVSLPGACAGRQPFARRKVRSLEPLVFSIGISCSRSCVLRAEFDRGLGWFLHIAHAGFAASALFGFVGIEYALFRVIDE